MLLKRRLCISFELQKKMHFSFKEHWVALFTAVYFLRCSLWLGPSSSAARRLEVRAGPGAKLPAKELIWQNSNPTVTPAKGLHLFEYTEPLAVMPRLHTDASRYQLSRRTLGIFYAWLQRIPSKTGLKLTFYFPGNKDISAFSLLSLLPSMAQAMAHSALAQQTPSAPAVF